MLRRRGIVDAWRIVHQAEANFPAAIEHVVEDAAVASRQIDRFEDNHCGRVSHSPLGISAGQRKIDDLCVVRVLRIHLHRDPQRDLLVTASRAKRAPIKGRRLDRDHLHPDHLAVRDARRDQ